VSLGVAVRGPDRRLGALASAIAVIAGGVALALAASLSPARAEYDLCNQTSYVVRAAIAYKAGDDYQSFGWFTVFPGFCRPVIDKPLTEDTYYVHARTIIGDRGPMHDWAGDDQFCIANNDFNITGASNCEQRGYTSAYFSEVDVGHAKTWTTTLTEPTQMDLPKAQILGVQRLLMNLGYITEGEMDGYLGHTTTHALEKFDHDKSLDLPQEPSIALFQALMQAAADTAKGEGLQLCNSTPYAVWAAVGLPSDTTDVTTKGWFKIQPNACVKPILEPLTRSYVYVYGETADGAAKKLYWRGADHLCTNDVLFSITAKPDSCDDQGLIPEAFQKVSTNGKALWIYTFKEEEASDRL
jgi:uncharacterized membrane protein